MVVLPVDGETWEDLGSGMVMVAALWNLRLLGSRVIIGLTTTSSPNTLETISSATG